MPSPKVTLVLLPGMDGTGQMLAPFLDALGDRFTVTVVSYPTTEPMGYPALEKLVLASLPANEPFVLLGESFSGPIAISLAALRPPNLLCLILCCTFIRNPRPLLAGLRALVPMLPVGAAPASLLHWALLGRHSTAALRNAMDQTVAQIAPVVMRERLLSVMSVDVSEKLAFVPVPVLCLRASHDRLIPRAASQLIARLKPDVRVVDFDAPHCLLQVASSRAAKVVEEFVSEIQGAAGPSPD